MPKKASGLTGGTGDVNPQWYRLALPSGITLNVTGGGAEQTGSVSASFPVPVPKFSSGDGTAVVMELLKTRWTTDTGFDPNSGAGVIVSSTAWLTTKAPSNVGVGLLPSCANPADGTVVDFNQGSLAFQNSIGIIYTFRYTHLDNIPVYSRFILLQRRRRWCRLPRPHGRRRPRCSDCHGQHLLHPVLYVQRHRHGKHYSKRGSDASAALSLQARQPAGVHRHRSVSAIIKFSEQPPLRKFIKT